MRRTANNPSNIAQNFYKGCSKQVLPTLGVMAFAFQVGTGGAFNLEYLLQRGQQGYPIPGFERKIKEAEVVQLRSVSDEIDHIKLYSNLSVTDLATLMNVSRTAIYDWQKGKSVTAANLDRLKELANAVSLLSSQEFANEPLMFHRKIVDGKSFIDLGREGYSLKEAAETLTRVLYREHEERKTMDKLLANRQKPRLNFNTPDIMDIYES